MAVGSSPRVGRWGRECSLCLGAGLGCVGTEGPGPAPQPPADDNGARLEIKLNARVETLRGAWQQRCSPRQDETECDVPDFHGAGAAVLGMLRVTPASLQQAEMGIF